jgi:hypothetical protein
MIKKTIKQIGQLRTFIVLLAGLDTGFSVINGLLTHKRIIRKKADRADAKPYREVVTVPIQPLLVQTLRPQMVEQPISERPLRKRSG